ncbi:MAG: metal-sensitive transcriptional regulator [Clostridiaceae bacterium]|jgi:DNA-binding FrmR family transcriptional regulator|nr:metal-sensitive transcriptional regulator [Clostridiaceae bacterium]
MVQYRWEVIEISEKRDVSKEDIIKRFKRIEGQVKGIQRMIEEDKNCIDILTQIAAVRAAVNKAGSLMLEKHSMTCIENAAASDDRKKAVEDLTKAFQSFISFTDR